jgi:Protein of unknown function (DUF2397)
MTARRSEQAKHHPDWQDHHSNLIRDEEVVGSNPATPTAENAGQGRCWEISTGPDLRCQPIFGAIWGPTSGAAPRWLPASGVPPSSVPCAARPGRVIPTACAKEPADGTTIAMHPWFRALKARAEEQERARLEHEVEQQRLREERERQEAERRRLETEREERERREWEAALSVASIKAVHAVRTESFGTALEQWQAAGEIRVFCTALDEAAAAAEGALETGRLREWSAWGKAEADRLVPDVIAKLRESCGLGAGLDADTLTARLEQLERWGNLLRGSHTVKASSVTEYQRAHARYQLSRLGERIQRDVDGVLAEADAAREVSNELPALVELGLRELAELVAEPGGIAPQEGLERVSTPVRAVRRVRGLHPGLLRLLGQVLARSATGEPLRRRDLLRLVRGSTKPCRGTRTTPRSPPSGCTAPATWGYRLPPTR